MNYEPTRRSPALVQFLAAAGRPRGQPHTPGSLDDCIPELRPRAAPSSTYVSGAHGISIPMPTASQMAPRAPFGPYRCRAGYAIEATLFRAIDAQVRTFKR